MAFFGDARTGEEGYQAWLSSTFGGDVPGLVEAGLSEAAIGLETEVGAAVGLDESGLEQLLGESVSAVGLGESGLTQLLGESVAEVGLDGSVADTASDFSSWAEVGPGIGGTGSVLSTSDAVSLGSFLHISMSGELVPLRPEEAPASLVEDSGPGAGPGAGGEEDSGPGAGLGGDPVPGLVAPAAVDVLAATERLEKGKAWADAWDAQSDPGLGQVGSLSDPGLGQVGSPQPHRPAPLIAQPARTAPASIGGQGGRVGSGGGGGVGAGIGSVAPTGGPGRCS